ncbi:hypothetical protein ABVK25_010428 [Lepraria finkii]|uniref:LAGLIDADG homing endonuclease n=1 Tax=Lepraria finkii TaxID=1340010 RepID=A0ABR4AUR4_9LECA
MPKSLTNHVEDLEDASRLSYINFVEKGTGSCSITILVRSIPPMKHKRIVEYLQKNHSTKTNGRYEMYKYLVTMDFPLFFFYLATTPPKSHHSKYSKNFRTNFGP